MTSIFDYTYYRLAKAYFKWDGETASTAFIGLSLIQALLIAIVFFPVLKMFYTRADTAPYAKSFGTLGGIIFLLFCFYNYKRYKGKYYNLSQRWKNESITQKRVRGFLLVLAIPTILILGILLGTL
jgi:uncharacterized membrane protein